MTNVVPSQHLRVVWSHPAETTRWATALGEIAMPRDVILLDGPLGAGKTHFVKGLAQGLGIPPNEVTSPSFSLIQEYAGRLPLFHMDVYRLVAEAELSELLLPELMEQEAVFAIEWLSKFKEAFPATYLHIQFDKPRQTGVRSAEITAHGAHALKRLEHWQQQVR